MKKRLLIVLACAPGLFAGEVRRVDNSDTNQFSALSGAWQVWNTTDAALNESNEFLFSDSIDASAQWVFTNLAGGRYLTYASFNPEANRTTQAVYAVSGTPIATVNQQDVSVLDIWREVGGIDNTEPPAGEGAGYVRLHSRPLDLPAGYATVTVTRAGAIYAIADAVQLESVRDDVLEVFVIDTEGPTGNQGTYTESTGLWNTWVADPADHRLNIRFATATPAACAFTFTNLPSGLYRVSATWGGGGNRPTDAQFYIAGGPSVTFNQQIGATQDVFEGSSWNDLFTLSVDTGTLTLNLENPPGGGGGTALIADAIRLERIVNPLPGGFLIIR